MTEKFYINPLTGRTIKSTGIVYKKLIKKYTLEKDKCLYNLKSAKKCFKRLHKHYPNIVYPSSNFKSIPKTYDQNNFVNVRAFIKDNGFVTGYINQNGKIFRLHSKIDIEEINKDTPFVIDYKNTLPNFIEKLPKIKEEKQEKIVNHLEYSTPKKDVHILFNHLQKDFIPLNKQMDKEHHDKILDIYNNNLIKNDLSKSKNVFDIDSYPEIDENKKKKSPKLLEFPKIKLQKTEISPIIKRKENTIPNLITPPTTPTTPTVPPPPPTTPTTPTTTTPQTTPTTTTPQTTPTTPTAPTASTLITPPTTPTTQTTPTVSTLITPPTTQTEQTSTTTSISSFPSQETKETINKDFQLDFVNNILMQRKGPLPKKELTIAQYDNDDIIGYLQ